MKTAVPSIDSHKDVAPLLQRESEILSELHALRNPSEAPATAADTLKAAALKFLAGGDGSVLSAAEQGARRQERIRLLEAALRELRAHLAEARSTARRELVKEHRLAERAAEHRQRIFDQVRQLHGALAEAGEFATALHLAELWQGNACWPGQDDNLRRSLAAHLLRLADLGCTLHPAERTKLEAEIDQRIELPLAERPAKTTVMQRIAGALS